MMLVWFAVLLAPGSGKEDSLWSPWYEISDGEVDMALPLQIEQTSPSDATIGIGCDGVAKPTIYLDSVNDKGRGKVKVQGCMQDYIGLGGGYNCRMGK